MLKSVIFDFDGVIVDTMEAHFRTWKRLAYFLGFELPENLKDKMRGASRDKSLQLVLDHGEVEASESQKAFYAHMKDTWFQYEIGEMSAQTIAPGVLALLSQLRQAGIQTAVASASKNAAHILKQLELEKFFDLILDANDIKTSKPHPEVFNAVLDALHTKAGEAVVIEDGVMGVKAAKAAGIVVVAIGNAPGLAEADQLVEDITQLDLEKLQSYLAGRKDN